MSKKKHEDTTVKLNMAFEEAVKKLAVSPRKHVAALKGVRRTR